MLGLGHQCRRQDPDLAGRESMDLVALEQLSDRNGSFHTGQGQPCISVPMLVINSKRILTIFGVHKYCSGCTLMPLLVAACRLLLWRWIHSSGLRKRASLGAFVLLPA
jgi:hypothetical protein